MGQILTELKTFLRTTLPTYSELNWELISFTEHTKHLTDDPGNELIFFAHLIPTGSAHYGDYEPCINIRGLNNALNATQLGNGHYAITIEPPIGLIDSILLPITCLS